MPVFTIETPSGRTLDIEAADEVTALRGAQEWDASSAKPQANPAVSQPAPQPAPSKDATFMDSLRNALGYSANTAGYAAREARRGVAMMAGAPADLLNAGLRYAGVPVPGRNGDVSAGIDYALGGFGAIPEPRIQPDMFQRVVGRAAMEVGSSMIPAAGFIAKGASMGVPAARAMANTPYVEGAGLASKAGTAVKRGLGRMFEAGAVAPEELAAREAGAAVAAGTGAGIANEVAGNPQHGNNFKSDFTGSLLGLLGHGIAGATRSAIGNLGAAALGRPDLMDNIAREEVANRVINNSSTLQDQFARTGSVDTSPLIEMLRRPSAAEEAIPGFVANIGDRTRDPGLTSFAFNTDALLPGAAAARRAGNESAVSQRMLDIAPQGDAGQFRSALENARTQELAAARTQADQANEAFSAATRAVQPGMADATARGSSLRAALQDASDRAREQVDQAWAPVNQANVNVDVAPLIEQFNRVDGGLSTNELRRFQPAEAGLPERMVNPATEPAPTGLLDASGDPIMRPGEPASGMQPLREVTGLRAGLSDSILAAPAASNEQRILRQYRDALDSYVDAAVPPELRAQYDAARAATRDFHDRFSRPGDAIAETLKRREGGGYQLDPSAVPGRFAPTNQGKVSDFQALLREAGKDVRARNAVADQVMTEARAAGALDNPQGMTDFLAQRSIVLGQFPELRNRLQNVGFSRAALDETERSAANTERDLMTPGRSATASYLRYGDERTIDAIRTVTNAGQPVEAARELISRVGNTPEARAGLRDAFWQDVLRSGKDSAKTATGGDKWNGRKLADFLNDPKRRAVADELWSDRPEELSNIRQVFGALAEAEGSVRARAAGSSGTAQALNGKFDPALSPSSIASRVRSVQRGQLSPSIAAIDLVTTFLRRKQTQVQQRAIDNLTSAVVNNPDMAADLLERFNPADLPARRRMLTQKYGVRGTQIGNMLDEAQNDDQTVEAVKGQ